MEVFEHYFWLMMVIVSVFMLVAYFVAEIMPEISYWRFKRRARQILEESRGKDALE